MNSGDIAQLDKEIAQLESRLGSLHGRRVEILEKELKAAQEKVQALQRGGSAAVVGAPRPRGRRPKQQTAAPSAPAAAAPATPAAPAAPAKKRGKKRTRMSTEEVEQRITDTVKDAGSAGLSLKEISDRSGVNYQTCAKKLKEMSNQFEKRGELKDARYTYKG